MKNAVDRQGNAGAHAFVGTHIIAIVPGNPRDFARSVGTGTILKTRAGQTVILTARHVLDDENDAPLERTEQFKFVLPLREGAVHDGVERVVRAPDGVDVAVVVPRRDVCDQLLPFAVAADFVAAPKDAAVTDETWCIVCGFPGAITLYAESGPKRMDQMFGGLTFGCGPITVDAKRRYQIEWREAVPQVVDKGAARALNIEIGTKFQLPPPNGMSGGPLWRFRGLPKGELWAPSKVGRIIGVQSAWDQSSILFVESVAMWGAWFNDVVAELDEQVS